jgi:hypothetical protein
MGLTGRTGLLMLSALGGDRDRDRDRDAFRFQVLPGAGDTLTLAVEVVAGSPEPTWHFHDGTAQVGLSVTKAYAAAGTYPVTLRLPGLRARISRLDFAGQPVKFDLAQLRTWTALTHIDAYSNAATVLTGQLRDLPATMTTLYLYSTSSTITGSLADLPPAMEYLVLGNTSSTITPGVGVRARAICGLYLDSTGMSQAAVDAIAEWLYINRALFTYAWPSANLGGTNAAPSGIYQDGDPPTTGKEYIYEVVNDPEGEGFNKWSVTYTA